MKSKEKGILLLDASKSRNVEGVKELLDNGANVNAQDEDGWTALLNASYYGHLEVLKELLKHGADMDLKNKWGCTALDYAGNRGTLEIAELLKAKETVK